MQFGSHPYPFRAVLRFTVTAMSLLSVARVYDGELIGAYGCGVFTAIPCVVLSYESDLCSEVPGSHPPCFALCRVTTSQQP